MKWAFSLNRLRVLTDILGYLLLPDRIFHTADLMDTVKLLYWISLALLFYCYIGYGILVFIINVIKRVFTASENVPTPAETLPVTLLITAYNEEKIIEEKIRNTLDIDYPADKLHLIFVTDGSADSSNQLIEKYPRIQLLHEPQRKGKYAAIKRALQFVQTPIVVFSDANTMLNKQCIQQMLVHYSNAKVGGVAGEKRIEDQSGDSPVGNAEGMYWQYESFLKKQDAGLYTVVGAAGELFSIRTALFQPLPDDLVLDDFVISMQVCLQGYKIAYEPGAFASELPSASLAEEEKRKVRISAGAYQSIGYLRSCLNVFRYPLLSFQYISRRLLRWVFCPLLLIGLLVTNILLAAGGPAGGMYSWLLLAQIIFFALAFIGWWLVKTGRRSGLLTIPFYFMFMNYCLVKGCILFARGKQTVLWEKSLREPVVGN